ncbi:MAG: diguanylate cyclase [Gemmatimonadota bacterium]
MHRLLTVWRQFRGRLDVEQVPELARSVGEARRELHRLAALLGLLPTQALPAARRTTIRSTDAQPAARTVIRASRALDALIWNAGGDWVRFRSSRDPQDLAALEEKLTRARGKLVGIREAIPGGPHPALTPLSAPSRASDGPAVNPRDIGALLWRIASDWQHLRKRPAAERAGMLISELSAAAEEVGRLQGRLLAGELDRGTQAKRRGPSPGLEAANQDESGQAYRDGFTGAYNRDGFDARAGAELKRCRRYQRSFGLLLMRVEASDLVDLRRRIQVIQEELRDYDLVSRYVDQLIAVGLPESEREGALAVAKRVRLALRDAGLDRPADRLAFASCPDDGQTLSSLITVAERRLDQIANF